MSPFLIDSRGLLKLVLLSVFFGFLLFAAGFVSGYQRSEQQRLGASRTLPLPLPALAESAALTEEDMTASGITTSMAPGADIDVDLPDNTPVHLVETESLPAGVAGNIRPVPASPSRVQADPARVKAVADSPVSVAHVSASHEGKKYSIQVGTYRRLENAENMVSKLQQQRLAAYVSSYHNRKQQLRYTVRFGEYSSRRLARDELARYRKGKNHDGYIVTYSAKNIVDLAKTDESKAELPPGSRSQGEKSDSKRPGTKSRVGIAEALSRAEPVVSAGHELN